MPLPFLLPGRTWVSSSACSTSPSGTPRIGATLFVAVTPTQSSVDRPGSRRCGGGAARGVGCADQA